MLAALDRTASAAADPVLLALGRNLASRMDGVADSDATSFRILSRALEKILPAIEERGHGGADPLDELALRRRRRS